MSRLQTGKGEHFWGVLELAEIPRLREEDSGGQFADAGQGKAGRIDTPNTLFDLIVQLTHLGVDLVIQLQQDQHQIDQVIAGGADRAFCQGLELNKVTHGEAAALADQADLVSDLSLSMW